MELDTAVFASEKIKGVIIFWKKTKNSLTKWRSNDILRNVARKSACECSSVGRASRCQRDCRRFDSGHSLQIFNIVWQVSSVGRAGDWKSPCPQFDSGTGHHFFVLMPYGDTPFGFFCACVWGWIARIYLYFGKTENLKSRHSGGLKSAKIPQILRLAIFGDTRIRQVASAWYTKKIP